MQSADCEIFAQNPHTHTCTTLTLVDSCFLVLFLPKQRAIFDLFSEPGMTIGELRALPVGRGHIGQVRYLPLGLSGKGRGRGNNQVNIQHKKKNIKSVDNSVADPDPGSGFRDPVPF